MKRGRGLTGGTGDVRPQVLTFQVTQATVNQEQIGTVRLPINRYGARQDLAQLVEILSVDWYITGDTGDQARFDYAILATNTPGNAVQGTAGSVARFENQINDHRTVSSVFETAALTTSGSFFDRQPFQDNLEDGAGHGVLVATDSMTMVVSGTGNTAVLTATAKITYRLINVGISEYVGIVQSQS